MFIFIDTRDYGKMLVNINHIMAIQNAGDYSTILFDDHKVYFVAESFESLTERIESLCNKS